MILQKFWVLFHWSIIYPNGLAMVLFTIDNENSNNHDNNGNMAQLFYDLKWGNISNDDFKLGNISQRADQHEVANHYVSWF